MKEKEDELRKKILTYVALHGENIPAFLFNEFKKILKYLNFYKLQKIYIQIDEVSNFINNIGKNFYKEIFKSLK